MNKMLLLFPLLDVFGRYWERGPGEGGLKLQGQQKALQRLRSRLPHTQRTPLGLFENHQAHILVELLNLRGWALSVFGILPKAL